MGGANWTIYVFENKFKSNVSFSRLRSSQYSLRIFETSRQSVFRLIGCLVLHAILYRSTLNLNYYNKIHKTLLDLLLYETLFHFSAF